MKLLLVDDERISRQELKTLLLENDPFLDILEADSCASALGLLKQHPFDGAFLDVELGDGKGIDLAMQAIALQPAISIVFATAYDRFALDAFKAKALDYVLKPFSPGDVGRAYRRLANVDQPSVPDRCSLERLTVWADDKAVVLSYPEICYITALNKQTKLVTKNQTYTIKQSLDQLESRLAGCGFLRIQRSYIVNLNRVSEIIPWFNHDYALRLQGVDDVIPISRQKLSNLREYFDF